MPVSTLTPFEAFHLNLYFFFTEVTPSILCVRARLGGGLAENRRRRAGELRAGDWQPLGLDERAELVRRDQLRCALGSRGQHAHDHVREDQRGRKQTTACAALDGSPAAPKIQGLHWKPKGFAKGFQPDPMGYRPIFFRFTRVKFNPKTLLRPSLVQT